MDIGILILVEGNFLNTCLLYINYTHKSKIEYDFTFLILKLYYHILRHFDKCKLSEHGPKENLQQLDNKEYR